MAIRTDLRDKMVFYKKRLRGLAAKREKKEEKITDFSHRSGVQMQIGREGREKNTIALKRKKEK